MKQAQADQKIKEVIKRPSSQELTDKQGGELLVRLGLVHCEEHAVWLWRRWK